MPYKVAKKNYYLVKQFWAIKEHDDNIISDNSSICNDKAYHRSIANIQRTECTQNKSKLVSEIFETTSRINRRNFVQMRKRNQAKTQISEQNFE